VRATPEAKAAIKARTMTKANAKVGAHRKCAKAALALGTPIAQPIRSIEILRSNHNKEDQL